MTTSRVTAGVPTGGQFASTHHAEADLELGSDDDTDGSVVDGLHLPSATPVQVDERLAAIYERLGEKYSKLAQAESHVAALESPTPWGRRGNHVDIARARARVDQLGDECAVTELETIPYDEEFSRRGGWTRAFLVDNPNGHLHSSRRCFTCNRGESPTAFHFATEYSGADEAFIVDEAGSDACTECYPTAPVETLARESRIDSPRRREQRAAAAERAAVKAAKAAKNAVEQLLDPTTGEKLRVIEVGLSGETEGKLVARGEFKTERSASIEAVRGLTVLRHYGAGHPSAPGWTATAEAVSVAIAAKHGRDATEVFAELTAKAEKKFKAGTF